MYIRKSYWGIAHVDLSEEGLRDLHSIDATGPGPGNASITLCTVHLVIVCRDVWWVKDEDIDGMCEAARQWTSERRDDWVKRNLIPKGLKFEEGGGLYFSVT
jgi:hypothetical protein